VMQSARDVNGLIMAIATQTDKLMDSRATFQSTFKKLQSSVSKGKDTSEGDYEKEIVELAWQVGSCVKCAPTSNIGPRPPKQSCIVCNAEPQLYSYQRQYFLYVLQSKS